MQMICDSLSLAPDAYNYIYTLQDCIKREHKIVDVTELSTAEKR